MQKRQNGGRRAWPDMFIAKANSFQIREKTAISDPEYALKFGLFIELKRENTRLKKKDDSWASEHIAEQAEVLERLRDEGYVAEFAVGFDEAKQIIDEYLGKEEDVRSDSNESVF